MNAPRINERAPDLGEKYRILMQLGEGGTATVALAVARGPGGFNKLVVLKSLKAHLCEDAEFRAMFLAEARLAARLNHPNIVQTNEVFEAQQVPIIVMEYLEGQPLSAVLTRGRANGFTQAMHLRVIADALSGLHSAHELADFDGTQLGLVHRDMTPHNILVTFEGQSKVLDFGIAKLDTAAVETQAGIVKGKLRYMSPEQLAGDKIDARADVFAVGVMLWEAAAGKPMWTGRAEGDVMSSVLNGDIPSPRTVNPDLSESFEQLVMKALAPNPEQRYRSAAELQAQIECVLTELGQVTTRDVGKAVSTMFDDVRSATKALIQTQFSRMESMTATEYQAAQLDSLSISTTATMTATLSNAASTVVTSLHSSRPKSLVAWLAATALAAGLIVWSLNIGQAKPTTAPAAATTMVQVSARTVNIRLSASPLESKLFFDDKPVPSNPFMMVVPADGSRHVVRAEADGYESSSTTVTLDEGRDVLVILKQQANAADAATEPSKRSWPNRAPVAPVAKPRSTGAEPNSRCDSPYFVDERGVKKFKRECL